jgi:hypothetical protein
MNILSPDSHKIFDRRQAINYYDSIKKNKSEYVISSYLSKLNTKIDLDKLFKSVVLTNNGFVSKSYNNCYETILNNKKQFRSTKFHTFYHMMTLSVKSIDSSKYILIKLFQNGCVCMNAHVTSMNDFDNASNLLINIIKNILSRDDITLIFDKIIFMITKSTKNKENLSKNTDFNQTTNTKFIKN